MVQLSSSKQRSERRIAVRLPLKVSGRDSRGVTFAEETASENLCRNGAAFVTRLDLPVGCDLSIHFPFSQSSATRRQTDFATRGRVVHVAPRESPNEKLIGIQFTGPRFRRVFRSESAA
ncbi:MAG: PilZ domain-containing protein [Acidobacteriota bacterium]|nr:PilZ domain-containing protein [Acidobacteriota bacterium]